MLKHFERQAINLISKLIIIFYGGGGYVCVEMYILKEDYFISCLAVTYIDAWTSVSLNRALSIYN